MSAGRVVLLVLAVVLLASCGGGGRTLMLPSWTLDVGGITTPLSLPAHFDAAVGDRPTRYTLRTRVELPPDMRHRGLAFTIPYFAALVSLSADGVRAEDLDAGALERYRGTGPHRFVIPAAATGDGELSLELTVEHRWTQSAWLDTVPRLSEGRAGDPGYVFVKLFNQGSDAAALAMLLLVGFANGIIFLADRGRTVYGWFTAASFLGATYATFSLGLTQPLFGVYDSVFMGAAVLLSALTMMRFTAGVFGRPLWRGWWALFLCFAIVAIRNAGAFRSTHYLAPITIFTTLVAAVYCVNLLVQEARRGRPPLANVLVTVAWPLVCVAACDDFASWLGLGELYYGVRGSCIGQALLALLQAAALGWQLIESLRRSDRLNAELAEQVAALQRHQRGDRDAERGAAPPDRQPLAAARGDAGESRVAAPARAQARGGRPRRGALPRRALRRLRGHGMGLRSEAGDRRATPGAQALARAIERRGALAVRARGQAHVGGLPPGRREHRRRGSHRGGGAISGDGVRRRKVAR